MLVAGGVEVEVGIGVAGGTHQHGVAVYGGVGHGILLELRVAARRAPAHVDDLAAVVGRVHHGLNAGKGARGRVGVNIQRQKPALIAQPGNALAVVDAGRRHTRHQRAVHDVDIVARVVVVVRQVPTREVVDVAVAVVVDAIDGVGVVAFNLGGQLDVGKAEPAVGDADDDAAVAARNVPGPIGLNLFQIILAGREARERGIGQRVVGLVLRLPDVERLHVFDRPRGQQHDPGPGQIRCCAKLVDAAQLDAAGPLGTGRQCLRKFLCGRAGFQHAQGSFEHPERLVGTQL